MNLSAFMQPEAVFQGFEAHSKKHAIQEMSAALAKLTGQSERKIFDTLLQRERLGSTGIGNGVAIPHGKLDGMDKLIGAFFQFAEPIEFEALDDQPVDLVFVLLAPEEAGADHLKALAKIARILRTPGMPEELRSADDKAALHKLLARTPAQAAG